MGVVKSLICSFTTALLVVAVSLIPLTAVAGTGTFGSYIGVDVGDGGGNVWYGGTQPGSTTLDSLVTRCLFPVANCLPGKATVVT